MKFEYLILPRFNNDNMDKDHLANAGEHGWELTAVDEFYFYFKKQKEEVQSEKISRSNRTYDYNIHD